MRSMWIKNGERGQNEMEMEIGFMTHGNGDFERVWVVWTVS